MRPGVPTTISTPSRMTNAWSSMLWPPTTHTVLKLVCAASRFASASI